MDFDINTVLGVAIGYLVAQAIRHFRRIRFWSTVAKTAKSYVESPDVPIDDAKIATEAALISHQGDQVERITRSLRQSLPPSTVPKSTLTDDDITPKLEKK